MDTLHDTYNLNTDLKRVISLAKQNAKQRNSLLISPTALFIAACDVKREYIGLFLGTRNIDGLSKDSKEALIAHMAKESNTINNFFSAKDEQAQEFAQNENVKKVLDFIPEGVKKTLKSAKENVEKVMGETIKKQGSFYTPNTLFIFEKADGWRKKMRNNELSFSDFFRALLEVENPVKDILRKEGIHLHMLQKFVSNKKAQEMIEREEKKRREEEKYQGNPPPQYAGKHTSSANTVRVSLDAATKMEEDERAVNLNDFLSGVEEVDDEIQVSPELFSQIELCEDFIEKDIDASLLEASLDSNTLKAFMEDLRIKQESYHGVLIGKEVPEIIMNTDFELYRSMPIVKRNVYVFTLMISSFKSSGSRYMKSSAMDKLNEECGRASKLLRDSENGSSSEREKAQEIFDKVMKEVYDLSLSLDKEKETINTLIELKKEYNESKKETLLKQFNKQYSSLKKSSICFELDVSFASTFLQEAKEEDYSEFV